LGQQGNPGEVGLLVFGWLLHRAELPGALGGALRHHLSQVRARRAALSLRGDEHRRLRYADDSGSLGSHPRGPTDGGTEAFAWSADANQEQARPRAIRIQQRSLILLPAEISSGVAPRQSPTAGLVQSGQRGRQRPLSDNEDEEGSSVGLGGGLHDLGLERHGSPKRGVRMQGNAGER